MIVSVESKYRPVAIRQEDGTLRELAPCERVIQVVNTARQRKDSPFIEPVIPFPIGTADEPAWKAFVNASQWLAQCGWCNSAQVISLIDPRMMCTTGLCMNQPVDGMAVRIELPPLQELLQIETVLLLRPWVQRRLWSPGETVQGLINENETRGSLPFTQQALAKVLRRKAAWWASLFGPEPVAALLALPFEAWREEPVSVPTVYVDHDEDGPMPTVDIGQTG